MGMDEAFEKLARSRFRSRFKLSAEDKRYIAEKGIDTIRHHAEDFIRTRIAVANPPNGDKESLPDIVGRLHGKNRHTLRARGFADHWQLVDKFAEHLQTVKHLVFSPPKRLSLYGHRQLKGGCRRMTKG